MRFVVCAVLIGGCASPSSTPDKHAHPKPLSAAEHSAEADRHAAVADAEEAAYRAESDAAQKNCAVDPVDGQSRIGTEPIRFTHPCFTSVTNPTSVHLSESLDNRREAKKHRRTATALLETEKRECAGLDEEAVSHSPFYHREDILSVEPLVAEGEPRGASVAFNKVKGLTRAWMLRALTCHQARAAVAGYKAEFMPYCPATVSGASIEVDDAGDRLIVRVRGSDGLSAATILGRAERLTQDVGK